LSLTSQNNYKKYILGQLKAPFINCYERFEQAADGVLTGRDNQFTESSPEKGIQELPV